MKTKKYYEWLLKRMDETINEIEIDDYVGSQPKPEGKTAQHGWALSKLRSMVNAGLSDDGQAGS